MKKTHLYIFCAITIVVFPAIGYLIYTRLVNDNFKDIFINHIPLWMQLILGLVTGIFAALIARQIIMLDFMRPVYYKYSEIFAGLNLTWFDVIIISLCAGIGEEILFRGAIQALWGIIPTAVFFVAIHGYLNPMDWRISIYGLYMTLVIVLIGYFTREYGIYTAITAHTIIDLILLFKLKNN